MLRWVLGLIVLAVVAVGGWYAYAYASTPAALRHPVSAHYHFRLQVIVGGQAVNFADAKYQTEFNKDICSAALTKEPVHFHDQLDQFVHIHWNHLTGGIVLKDYGWKLIGGTANTLGYRFDQFPKLVRVPVHGHDLPNPPAHANYYVYTGDKNGYKQRDWDAFLHDDLRDFFAGQPSTSFLNRLAPPDAAASAGTSSEEKLAKLNDVLGSVVIFAQDKAPAAAQIKERFEHLVALPESVCGG